VLPDELKATIRAEYKDMSLPQLLDAEYQLERVHVPRSDERTYRLLTISFRIDSFDIAKHDLEVKRDEFTAFVDEVWHAVTQGSMGDWDYPAQVLRHMEDELARLRSAAQAMTPAEVEHRLANQITFPNGLPFTGAVNGQTYPPAQIPPPSNTLPGNVHVVAVDPGLGRRYLTNDDLKDGGITFTIDKQTGHITNIAKPCQHANQTLSFVASTIRCKDCGAILQSLTDQP
jgi:hypothetical protein